MAFKIKLETTDLDAPEFQEYLTANGIAAMKKSDAVHVLGAGDIIEYTAASRGALAELIHEYFDCGDAEVTREMIAGIK